MLGQVKQGLVFAVGAAAAIGWGMWYMTDQAHQRLLVESAEKLERSEANNTKLRAALDTSNGTIEQMRADALENYKQKLRDDAEADRLRNELATAQSQINKYKEGWTNAATKRPGLLSRLANRATRQRVQRIEAATCRTDCDRDKDSDEGS